VRIEDAILQKHFPDVHLKAHINILYTAAWMNQISAQVLKPYGLTWQQYNILRILKGMHPKPASIKELTRRMIDKMSNASRLVDKLERKGWAERRPAPEDRRRVRVTLTPEGFQVLERVTEELEQAIRQSMQNLSREEAETLNTLLDKLRGA